MKMTKAQRETDKEVERVRLALFEMYDITKAEIFRDADLMIFFFYELSKEKRKV